MLSTLRSAFSSVWGNKLPSLLALLGVVIGVASVTTLVALGQGLKKDVSGLIEGFGTNVIVVVSGKVTAGAGAAPGNPADYVNGDILTRQDVQTVQQLPGIEQVAPVSLVSGSIKYGSKTAVPTLFGTTPSFLQAFQTIQLDQGRMFGPSDGAVIVISSQVRQQLFADQDPLGKQVLLGGQPFQVIGVLGKEKGGSLFSSQLDTLSLIPFDQATALNKGEVKIVRIIAKAADTADVRASKDAIQKSILADHQGEENFSVLTQDDILGLFDQVLNLATALVSAIAAISLLVGGIGIMNIMLVTVTERTREIGLRKALGATRGAILLQFLTEALVITLFGGLLGLALAFAAGQAVALKTPLHPQFSLPIVLLVVGVSVLIGVLFGIWPALRAAGKDPIEALRYE